MYEERSTTQILRKGGVVMTTSLNRQLSADFDKFISQFKNNQDFSVMTKADYDFIAEFQSKTQSLLDDML